MPCACRDKASLTPNSTGVMTARATYDDDGMVSLFGATEQETTPYHGVYRSATLFVVGLGTPDETIYPRKDRTKALNHARDSRLALTQVPARALPHETAIALLGK